MSIPRLFAAGTVLLANVVLAQVQNYTAHPIDNPAANTYQNIPIAGGGAPFTGWDEARSQFLLTAPYLPTAGGLITALEVKSGVNGTSPYDRFEIWLDHTANTVLSTTFANNLTNPILVYSQSPGSITWTNTTWTTLPLTVPFAYDGSSNLVIEVRKKLNRPANPPQVYHALKVWPYRNDLPLPIWAYGSYGSGAVDATTAMTTSNTLLLWRLQWAGGRTLTIDSTRDTTGNGNRGYFHIGATLTVTAQGTPGEFYISAIDLGLSPVGVPFPPINGELWLGSVNLVGSGLLDGAGRGSVAIPIPNNVALIGLHIYFQSLVSGASAFITNIVDASIEAY